MGKYFYSSLMFLCIIVLAIGFVGPGQVKALDLETRAMEKEVPANACGQNQNPLVYLERAYREAVRAKESLEHIPNPITDPIYIIHHGGYGAAANWLVKAYQNIMCAKIKTPETISIMYIDNTEKDLKYAADALQFATTADTDYVRKNIIDNPVIKLPGSYTTRNDALAEAIKSYLYEDNGNRMGLVPTIEVYIAALEKGGRE